MAMRVCDR